MAVPIDYLLVGPSFGLWIRSQTGVLGSRLNGQYITVIGTGRHY